MARALQYSQEIRWPARWLRLAALILTLAAGVLEAAAARLSARAAVPLEAEREVGVLEIGGQRYGAIYEGGRLVALLEHERL